MSATDLPDNTCSQSPSIAESAFIAKGAQVMGDVTMADSSSIWYNSVVRGDINKIVIGERTNIQDGCILHIANDHPCIVGNDVTVGHHVNLHGCTVEDGCLIGIGAIVLTGAKIGRGSIVAAGAVVKEHEVVPPGSMVVGIPAKKIRDLDESTYENNLKWAAKYVKLAKLHRENYGAGTCL